MLRPDTMNASLIINARDRLAWHHRLVSDASTCFMWAAWALKLGVLSHVALRVMPVEGLEGAPRYASALFVASGTLFVWSRLPAFRSAAPAGPSPADYAAHFEVSEAQVAAARRCSVCVVHHDERGRIVAIEPRG